ncbi:hypothetical protein N9I92_00925 [bacterium]|nr:hypothetical protein [bacterium]
MGIVRTKSSIKTQDELKADGYTTPETVAKKAVEDYECYVSSDGWTVCKKLSTTTPPPTGSSGSSGGTPSNTNTPRLTTRESKYNKYNLSLRADDPELQKEFKELYQELRSSNVLVSKLLRIQNAPNVDKVPERIVLFGRDHVGRNERFAVERDDQGEWGWINHDVGSGNDWFPFDAYNKLDESRGLSKVLNENDMEEKDNTSLSQMIDDKFREFNFYSANDKGKQKVVFTDGDREGITKEFDDLIKKYPEDIAFIRAVVIAKGEDKKSGEPIVRLGSYYNNANIELPFNSEMNGLGKLLDGGITYFSILNNEGPDYRDFKIVGGDKIPEVEFKDKDKKDISLNNYKNLHNQEMSKEEPFERVMKNKEKKGLAQLLNNEEITNELSKRQKEVLENLKKKGFKFKKPENGDIYERVRVSSKEFTESINAWKPKGK